MDHVLINCDLGEMAFSSDAYQDDQLIPYVDACNIACGYHAGDPLTIEKTIKCALEHGQLIGAHPSYPDREGFGRRKIQMESDELKACILYQISALKGMVESLGGELTYVKPHGALYNCMSHDLLEAKVVIEAIQSIDEGLSLMGMAASPLAQYCKENKIDFIGEAFADRRYANADTLVDRSNAHATLGTPEAVVKQVAGIMERNEIVVENGNRFSLKAKSICVHGDHVSARDFLVAIDMYLKHHGLR